jgi:uncharacterized integral membrane protein (TIGR00697 family)
MVVALTICFAARYLGHEILVGGYVALFCTATLISGKLGVVPGMPTIALSASIFTFSATFILTDVLSEVYGKAAARKAVLAGAIAFPAMLVTTQFASVWAPHASWSENQWAFENVMSMALRTTVASMIAYLVSQLHDVWAFHFWRARTRGRFLWIRNNLSTLVSQALDTMIFYLIAFYGVFPVQTLILATYAAKIAIAIIDTPVVYAAVAMLKGAKHRLPTQPGEAGTKQGRSTIVRGKHPRNGVER